jgi:hypothetical protein
MSRGQERQIILEILLSPFSSPPTSIRQFYFCCRINNPRETFVAFLIQKIGDTPHRFVERLEKMIGKMAMRVWEVT